MGATAGQVLGHGGTFRSSSPFGRLDAFEGRTTFIENDARVAESLYRVPINRGAVAVSDVMINIYACRRERITGSDWEGKLLQPEITRPGQIDYGTMLPSRLDNLVGPVAVSATHIGFSTIGSSRRG